MANAAIGFQSTLTTPSNNFVAALYDPSTGPITLLEQQLIPKSGGIYPPGFSVTFITTLTINKIYRVILWETSGTTAGGTSKVSGDFPASVNSVNLRSPLYLTADISAGLISGTNTYVDSTLIGWGIYIILPGSGPSYPGAGNDYTFDPTTGTITYLLGNWAPGQRVPIFFQPQITAAAPSAVSAIQSGAIITASRSLVDTDKNKALYLQATGSGLSLPLPALSTISDYDHIVLYSNGGNHINAVIPTSGSDIIQRYKTSTAITQLILGQGEKLDLFKANGVWNVDYIDAQIDRVGEIVYKYTKGDLNLLFADGSLLNRAQYPRLFAYVQALQTAGAPCVVTEATWAASAVYDGITYFPNKGCWTMGDLSTTFRIPLLYATAAGGVGFLRGVDGIGGTGSRASGSFQIDGQEDLQYETLTGAYPPIPPAPGPNGRGLRTTSGGYNGIGAVPNDLTGRGGLIVGTTFQTSQKLFYENRPINYGIYLSIRI